jgi:hypothetical protein
MGTRLLIVIATGHREKALAGLMYARNVLKYQWLEEAKVVLFGPSEKLAALDDEVRQSIKEISARSDCYACKAISDKDGVSEKLEEAGIKVEYVGATLSNAIRQGYTPMVW